MAEWPKFIEPYLAEREALRLFPCSIKTKGNLGAVAGDTGSFRGLRWPEPRLAGRNAPLIPLPFLVSKAITVAEPDSNSKHLFHLLSILA
jgi:hypothetical protein